MVLTPRNGSIAALLAAAALMSACGGGGSASTAPPQSRTVPVTVAVAEIKDVPVEVRAIGNVSSFSIVYVRSRVGGAVSGVHFKQGDLVKKGQLLFTIDPRPFQAALSEAEARLARDRTELKNSQSDVVKADEAAVKRARLQVEYCSIVSPVPGRAGDIQATEGKLVKVNDDNPLVTILQVRPVYATFSVPEMHLPEIQKRYAGGPVDVQATVSDSKDTPHHGVISFVDNAVSTKTGTILLKATFPNEDEALWPGQYVEVVLTLSTQARATVVPSQAVQTGQQGSYVFVVKPDATAESRPVTVERTFENLSIIEQGIEPGETVVTDGQLRLVPGAKVEIKNSAGKREERPS